MNCRVASLLFALAPVCVCDDVNIALYSAGDGVSQEDTRRAVLLLIMLYSRLCVFVVKTNELAECARARVIKFEI